MRIMDIGGKKYKVIFKDDQEPSYGELYEKVQVINNMLNFLNSIPFIDFYKGKDDVEISCAYCEEDIKEVVRIRKTDLLEEILNCKFEIYELGEVIAF